MQFHPGSNLLAAGGQKTVRFWSIPDGLEVRKVELEGPTTFSRGGLFLFSFTELSGNSLAVRDWRTGDPTTNTVLRLDGNHSVWASDASGEWLVVARDKEVYLSSLRERAAPPRLVGSHDEQVVWVASHPAAPRLITGDRSGEVRIWSFSASSSRLERTFRAPALTARLDSTDSWVIAIRPGGQSTSEVAHVWELKDPPDAGPFVLRNGESDWVNSFAISPKGRWLFTANAEFGVLWPLHQKYSRVLRGHSRRIFSWLSCLGGRTGLGFGRRDCAPLASFRSERRAKPCSDGGKPRGSASVWTSIPREDMPS